MNEVKLSLPSDFQNVVRLFPTPNTVLFPGVIQSLHVFEPQYRQLVSDAVEADGLIGLALQQPVAGVDSLAIDLFSTICIGKIISHARLDDGRYNLLLMGIQRARIVREIHDGTLYRMAEVEVLADTFCGSPNESRCLREQVIEEFRRLPACAALLDEESISHLLESETPLSQLLDRVAHSSGASSLELQALLGELDVARRGKRVLEWLRRQRVEGGGFPVRISKTGRSFPAGVQYELDYVELSNPFNEAIMRRELLLGCLFRLFFLLFALGVIGMPCGGVADEPQRPNILFAIADDWSQEHAGAYGCQWVKTPSFDRIAREGVLFNHAFTSNPKCSPCRASILTGRNTWQLKEAVSHYSIFPTGFAVYPELLERAGYHVGLTGKGWGPGDFKVSGYAHNPAGKEYQQVRIRKGPLDGRSSVDYAANFGKFLDDRADGQPFCFWYGAFEPHRSYEHGAGLRSGKRLKDVTVPPYFPDNTTVRSDLLDYAMEVEWFDTHLGRIIAQLEEIGELDNTLIIATSDHGMPFPRVKSCILEDGFHLPLAVRWGGSGKPGRTIDDFINVRDFAPTILQAAGVETHSQMTGRSFLDLLVSGKSGWNDRTRSVQLIGKERHDLGRPGDAGYPVRAIRTPEFLYVRNFEPDRWPAGNPETGYRCCDASPTKEYMVGRFDKYYQMAFGKRPVEELYRMVEDPDCMNNVAEQPEYAAEKQRLAKEMEARLTEEGDPRMLGEADFFDTIEYVGERGHAWDTWMDFRGGGTVQGGE